MSTLYDGARIYSPLPGTMQKTIAVRQEPAIATAKELREYDVSPKSMVKEWYDNIELASNKIKWAAGRKTSREHLCVVMGIENGVVNEVENRLVVGCQSEEDKVKGWGQEKRRRIINGNRMVVFKKNAF